MYATLHDLIEQFGAEELLGLTDKNGEGSIDTDTVDRALADACGEVDGYVAGAGYTTPLSPVPRIVRSVVADIARYRLHGDQALEPVVKRYDDAVKFLRAVAAGDIKLQSGAPESTAGTAQLRPGRQVFPGGGF